MRTICDNTRLSELKVTKQKPVISRVKEAIKSTVLLLWDARLSERLNASATEVPVATWQEKSWLSLRRQQGPCTVRPCALSPTAQPKTHCVKNLKPRASTQSKTHFAWKTSAIGKNKPSAKRPYNCVSKIGKGRFSHLGANWLVGAARENPGSVVSGRTARRKEIHPTRRSSWPTVALSRLGWQHTSFLSRFGSKWVDKDRRELANTLSMSALGRANSCS